MARGSELVVVVTGAPGAGAITPLVVDLIATESGAGRTGIRVLAAADAVEVPLLVPDASTVRAALKGYRLDVNVIALAERRKRLLIADMDSTMIEQECIDEMAAEFGLKDKIAAITERAMRGELAFEAALRERLSLLRGLDEAALERVYRERVTVMPGAKTLIATMTRAGAYTALVSGGFTFFTSRIARAIGFHTNRANSLAFEDGRLVGDVIGPVLGKEEKLAALKELAGLRGLPMSATLAVGDGANDLAMIKAAGLGVAYRAKPIVAAEAAASIQHGDLTALLYLQGFEKSEFASA